MELKPKLVRVNITLKNAMMTFVATALVTFIPSLFGMFGYSDFTSRVASKLLFELLFTLSNFLWKAVMPFTYEGIFLTIGWR